MNVQPYVFFDGKCEEALEFYKGAIGAKVDMMMRFSESPEKPQRRGRQAVQCRGQGWPGPDAARQDLLRLALRHGDRQVRRAVAGDRGEVLGLNCRER